MKKKIGSFVMVLAALALLFPCVGTGMTAYAEDGDFTIKNGVLTKYNGSGGDVVIPEGVKEIGQGVFECNYSLISVTFPDTVTKIDSSAFYLCTMLKSVKLPSSLTSIGGYAFSKCVDLQTVNIPNSVTEMGTEAFLGCYSLQSVNIPSSLKKIEDSVFSGCSALKSIRLSPSVTSIGKEAFSNCKSLATVTISSGVTEISVSAFRRCSNLTQFRVENGNNVFSSQDGVLYSKDKKKLVLFPCGKRGEFNVPNFVTTIGNSAFSLCEGVTGVDMPESVTKLEACAFIRCSSLTKVILPASLTEIEVIKAGEYPFLGCSGLRDAYYRGTVRQWKDISSKIRFESFVTCYCNYQNPVALNILTQPESAVIEPGESVTFSVKAEGELPLTYQWYYMKSGEESWSKWTGRTHATETVKPNETWNGIRLYCKVKDSSGKSVRSDVVMVLIMTDEEMEEIASDSCGDNLKWSLNQSTGTLTISGSGDMWDFMYEGFLFAPWSFDYDEFEFTADKVKKVVFNGNITSIGDSAFALCSELESVTIPDTVKYIGGEAFAGTGLTKITIPASVTQFGFDVFADAVIFQDEESYIGGFSKMASITVDGGNSSFSSENGVMFDKTKTELVCYPIAKQGAYIIPDTVKTIGAFSFSSAKGLTGVTIPASVRTIGVEAFSNCAGLDSVTIPEGVVTIEESAFLDAGLSSIYLPKSVQSIGYLALNNTDDDMVNLVPIHDIYYAGSKLAWSKIKTVGEEDDDFSFRDYLAGANIHYAEQSTEIVRHPESQRITFGDTLTLSVEAVGEGLRYQWYFKKMGQTSWALWNGRTHANEKVTPNATWDGIRLYCEVTDAEGNIIKSEPARITVVIPSIRIINQPEDKSVYLGDTVTLSVQADGKNLTYQWYYKKHGQTSFSKWNGHTHAAETVTPNATWNGIQLYCEIRDGAGYTVNSDTATVTVTETTIKITSQPISQSLSLGETMKLSVKAEGEGLTYQWYFKKAGQTSFSKWNNRTHASETVTPNATWNGIQLYCEIKDSAGNSVKSNTATITVTEPKIRITTQPVDQTVVLGDTIQLSVKAEGEALTYQWYFKKAGQTSFSKWNNRTHASETVTPNATWNGIQLYCEVKDGAGNTVKSNTATITVTEPKIRITTQPVSQTVALGDTIKLSVIAEGEGLTYQWYFKKAGQTSFSKWNGRTHATETVTPNATWDGIQLYCEMKENGGRCVRSDTVTITFK